jgi:cellulase/cellobiase CelA1
MMEWKRNLNEDIPPAGTRILVSDGEVITIAYYVTSDNHQNWIFENPNYKDIRIDWWKELDTLPPKIVSQDITPPSSSAPVCGYSKYDNR